jgi:acetyl-CoA C-acetyltransferase
MSQERIAIVDGPRTPAGKTVGALEPLLAHELGAISAAAAIQRHGIAGDDVDEVIVGGVGQVGPDSYNARRVATAAGLPDSTSAFNVNRLCRSGLQAVWSAAQQLRWAAAEVILAGGDEPMSRMPFLDLSACGHLRLGDRTWIDGTVAMVTDPLSEKLMGATAENSATEFGISPLEQDEFALRASAWQATQTLKRRLLKKSPRFTYQESRRSLPIEMSTLARTSPWKICSYCAPIPGGAQRHRPAIHRESTMAPQQWS